jgi:lon-related putative ATP-dependent protease
MAAKSVSVDRLYRRCPEDQLGFKESTAELEAIDYTMGQDRALGAVKFGATIDQPGFNVYVMGPTGSGKHTAVRALLEPIAARAHAPCDWAYVYNFKDPQRPRAIRLETGTASALRDAIAELIDDLKTTIPAVFESDSYRKMRQAIDFEFGSRQEQALEGLRKQAAARGIALLNTQAGMGFAAMKNGEVLNPAAFEALPEEEKKALAAAIEELRAQLAELLYKLPSAEKERRDRIRELNREVARSSITRLIDELRDRAFPGHSGARTFIEEVTADLIENVHLFLPAPNEEQMAESITGAQVRPRGNPLRRYEINVMVSNNPTLGAPILFEPHPSHANLVGRIEHYAQLGTLVSDLTLIRPGALHKAAGGFLLLDIRKLLTQPFAWETLKRALRTQQIKIESPADSPSVITTVTLDPEPIPLDIKVILFGEREYYYLLTEADPDFADFFKVQADFAESVDRTPESIRNLARLLASICRRSEVRPLDPGATARLIEHASRLSGDVEKLLVMVSPFADVIREADHIARQADRRVVHRADIDAAIEAQVKRADRFRERQQEAILRDLVFVETEGSKVGQVNGLSVLTLAVFAFGRPSRITARVRAGLAGVIDIEREVALGGPIHAKGMLILQGYLNGRYLPGTILSLSASIVFEQSYGGVEGDSASAAELLALLSAIAEVPLRQDLAITGSINQHGQIQAIGGANEKIEGFFDICRARGLTGKQGVAIPVSNVASLMLRQDVVEAVKAEKFHIFELERIEDAIELFAGMKAGERDASGGFPAGSFNAKVEERLAAFAKARSSLIALESLQDKERPKPGKKPNL